MPTPKTKRDIVLQSTFSSTNVVSTLSLCVDAQFTTQRGVGTANTFEDQSSGSSDEVTEYQISFGLSGAIGVMTIGFTGEGDDPVPGLTVFKTSAVSTIDPTPTTGTVTPIPSPDERYTRTWQQTALDPTSTQLVDQIGTLDVRVKAGSTYSVTQTVTSTAIPQLVLNYVWRNAAGAVMVSCTLTFSASAVAGSGYSLGTATASDNLEGSRPLRVRRPR